MDVANFIRAFDSVFSETDRTTPQGDMADLCPKVRGMTSPKVQRLLQLGASCVPTGECYFEVGTFHGKTLISAALENEQCAIFACDNFSGFDRSVSIERLRRNLRLYCSDEQSLAILRRFYAEDFRSVLQDGRVAHPIGFYFYDGAHTTESQRDAIRCVEGSLADEAIVVVDDWEFAPVRPATLSVIEDSVHDWKILYELPARSNADRQMWWHGVGVLSFNRRH